MRIIMLLLLLVPMFSNVAYPANFVDNDASGCSNGATDYNAATRSCGGGNDTIYTGIYNANAGISSGTQGSPVFINVRSGKTYNRNHPVHITKSWTYWRKYSGDAAKPVFDGQWNPNYPWSGLITIRAAGVTIDGFEIRNTGDYPGTPGRQRTDPIGYGIRVFGDNNDNVVVKNCYIHHIGGACISYSMTDNGAIENNELYECQYSFLEGRPLWGSAIDVSEAVDNLTITGNKIHGIGGEGTNLNRGCTNITVDRNIFYDVARPTIFINGILDSTIKNNIIYHTGRPRYLSYEAGIVVASEIFWPGAPKPSKYDSDTDGIEIYGNMIANINAGITVKEIWDGKQARNVRIYNNTVVGCGSNSFSIMPDSNRIGPGFVVKNNIFAQSSGPIAKGRPNLAKFEFDYNLWFSEPAGNYKGTNDPTHPGYSSVDIAQYFSRTDWRVGPDELSASDFDLLPTAQYAIDSGLADATFLSYSIPHPNGVDLGARPSDGPPIIEDEIVFSLVDADTNGDLFELENNDVINLNTVGQSLNIRADVAATINHDYIRFMLDGNVFRTESAEPYALAGDTQGNYNSWTPDLGSHRLEVVVYNAGNQIAARGSINFTVINSQHQTATFFPTADAHLENGALRNLNNLKVENSPTRVRESYIKFNVTGISGGHVDSASLKLTCAADPGNGNIRVHLGSHNNWNEQTLHASTPGKQTRLDQMNTTYTSGSEYTFDVSSAISSDGDYTFIVSMETGGNDVAFHSSEGAVEPELWVESTN